MDIYNQEFKKIIEDVSNIEDINISDIPCIDLYMDQVTSFFETKLEGMRRNEEDKILTKTMINNYTKAKILMPAKNKKYSKQHMILLILIYNLKQILSINDIDYLFSAFLDDSIETMNNDSIENLYNCFIDVKKFEEERFDNSIKEKLEKITEVSAEMNFEDQSKAEMFLTVLTLINNANMEKRMAEKIIDTYFVKEKKEK